MAVATERDARSPGYFVAVLHVERRELLLLAGLAAATLILRLPTFFEPPWHTDEGIFQAVAQRVAAGGRLYADAWESKPPLFLYLYAGLIELFGPGVLPLRAAAALAAFGTELATFAIARRFLTRRTALAAALLLTVMLAVPFWEGNLALTETFTLLPSTWAVLVVLSSGVADERQGTDWRLVALAGSLFGAAFLIRQTSAVVALAVVLWLALSGRAWLQSAMLIAGGAAAVVLPVALLFLLQGTFGWFWDANVGFFLHYVPSGREVPLYERPLILLPVLLCCAALLLQRRDGRQPPPWALAGLWLTLTLAAALLTGRPYSHYFLLVMPPLCLLLTMMLAALPRWRPALGQLPGLALAASLALVWVGIVAPAFDGNLLAMRYTKTATYYVNFASWAVGLKSEAAYQSYFDKRVDVTLRLSAALRQLGAAGHGVYIWGETPWAYALAGTSPATRYTTSFYVLLIPYLDAGLKDELLRADPAYIVVLDDAWPRVYDASGVLNRRYVNATRGLNQVLAQRYEWVQRVGRAQIFARALERPLVDERRDERDSLDVQPPSQQQEPGTESAASMADARERN